MFRKVESILLAVSLALAIAAPGSFGFVEELRARGYTLIPAPQKVELQQAEIEVDGSWGILSKVGEKNISARRLREAAAQLHQLEFSGTGPGKIVLEIVPGAVGKVGDPARARQAYILSFSPNLVRVTGNAEPGLFYGVQSLLQLLRRDSDGRLRLPVGTITDWPDLELRVIHWDTKHHQDRPETLKRFLDWLALFKVNAVAFEIEDKYEYPRHPIIGAPGAYTKQEMQELTRYALERQIQLVPVIQAPAHMTYVLKHPEFAHLRADGSNYQACMCDEEAIQLILDMYQDLIDATPGVKYFHVSTDEVYYAGICDKCQQKLPYNEVNRSQIWVDYVNRVHAWMAERGRQMMAWVEFPLLIGDIPKLPPGLIDAITVPGRSREWIAGLNQAGIRQLAYTPIQGEEYLFPNYYPTVYRGRRAEGRLQEVWSTIPGVLEKGAKPMGTFCAAWDDAGLHDETFWLGWAAVTQYGWTIGKPSLEQTVEDFLDVFYGPQSPDMREVYLLLQEGGRFYEDLWDRVQSKERGPAYGSSRGKIPYNRQDLTLDPPDLPDSSTLAVKRTFSIKYSFKLEQAAAMKNQLDRLAYLLTRNITRVSRNRYNLEVFFSIADLVRLAGGTVETMLDLEKVENFLVRASGAAKEGNHANAVSSMVEAHNLAANNLEEQARMWRKFQEVWQKSRYEKCRSVGGRNFVHVMDDVKDHFADRRLGLDYMLAPFERMNLPGWKNTLAGRIKAYAVAHDVPVTGLAGEQQGD